MQESVLEKPSALQELETRKATHRAGSEDWRSHPLSGAGPKEAREPFGP